MSQYNCFICKYQTTKRHIYEKHLTRKTHINKVMMKEKKDKKLVDKSNNYLSNDEEHINENNDFLMNTSNNNTTVTTIVDEAGNTIIEKTTYSTTNTTTDYDVHVDSNEFIDMMNSSLSELKSTGDKKAFVYNFFNFIFKHITDVRHSINN